MIDDNTVVRVTRYVKRHTTVNPATRTPETRTLHLDWGIGELDGGNGLVVIGSPAQIYSRPEGDPGADSHVLYVEETMPLSGLTTAWGYGTDTLHFKHPNI